MGMKAKEASGDQLLDWDHSGAAAPQTLPPTETSKPPFTRRQPQPPPPSQQQEQSESSLKCPRCDSDNTKFCYYNNYNKLQPRHFCKSCKRHWTHGGTLRNVPMGGGRKNKRPRTTTTTPKSTATTTMATFPLSSPNTNIGSDDESMSKILYHTLIQSTTSVNPHKRNNDMITPDYKPPQNSNAIEESSTLSNHASFLQPPQNSNALQEGSTLSNHASYLHPINDVFIDQYPDDITTWPSLNMINSDMDLSNCWNWNEIDEHAFVNSSDLNVAWDDVYWEAKP